MQFQECSDTVNCRIEKRNVRDEKLIKRYAHIQLDTSRFPDDMQPLTYIILKQQELEEGLIAQIGDEIFNQMKAEKKDFSYEEQLYIAKEILKREIGDLPFGGITFKKKYINVLGPTGVGKTTTIAKIAARALLEERRKLVLSQPIHIELLQLSSFERMRIYCKHRLKLSITGRILRSD